MLLILKANKINEISDFWWKKSLKKESSIINELFQGQMVNTIHCTWCKIDLYEFYNFTSLSLEIPKVKFNSSSSHWQKIEIANCFDETMKVVKFKKEQGFFCKFCNKNVEITKSLKIWRLPKLLVIYLQKFEISENSEFKSWAEVEVSKSKLDIRDYVHPKFLKDDSNGWYSLYGVINHSGLNKEGQYTAKVKSKGENSDWFRWNNKYGDKSDAWINNSAPNILFYNKI